MEQHSLLPQHADLIRKLPLETIRSTQNLPAELCMARDGDLSVYYVPFDYVNRDARIVLVGITPGFTQLMNALRAAQGRLLAGADQETTLRAAKSTGAFSGAMRPNLVALLDHCGIHDWLGISNSEELFSSASHLIQTTSVLRHPVFVRGENYNGTPNMTKHPLLRRFVLEHFAREAALLKDAVFVPLGPKVSEALAWLAADGVIDSTRLLDGLPHPSGANAERIAYFLGKKNKNELSAKTSADKIDGARRAVLAKMSHLKELAMK